jgi:DNA-binding NarL/FixJ family response regulator
VAFVPETEVGHEGKVSEKTVEAHLTHIYRKLELRSRTQLAVLVLTAQGQAGRGS